MAPPNPQNDDEDVSSSASETSSIASSDDEGSVIIRSPSKLLYDISSLPEERRIFIKDTLNDPPHIALQQCRSINGTYAFQMTELVTRSIRIHDAEEGSARLSCSCKDADSDTCPHLIWLLDQMTKQTLYDHEITKVLNMTEKGFAKELGDPYEAISKHNLEILAADLHCPVMDASTDKVDPNRALDARALLSSVYNETPEDFRPDIFDMPIKGRKLIKRHDLDQTIFRMLLDDSHFFNYFLSLSRSSDAINDPFRKLSQRVDLVLRSLDKPNDATATAPWAATLITNIITQIRTYIFSRSRPLTQTEASSATSTLIHILSSTIRRRPLYHLLIGDRDRDFVISTLELLPEAASPFLHTLEDLVDRMSMFGVPASYVDKFRALFGRLRKSRTGAGAGAGMKRFGHDGDERRAKRAR